MKATIRNIDWLAVAAVLVLSLFFSAAYAGGNTCIGNADCNTYNNTTNQGGQGGSATAGAIAGAVAGASVDSRNTNINTVSSRNEQGQFQAQKQGQEQAAIAVSEGSKASSQSGGGSASSGGNALTVNTQYAAPNMREMVPNVAIGGLYPSSPCMGTSNAGGSGPGFSIAVGTSWKDDDCGVRETARSFAGMGMNADALAVLCSSQYAKAAPSCAKAEAAKKVTWVEDERRQVSRPADQKRRTSEEKPFQNVSVTSSGCVSDPIVASRLGLVACQ